MKKIILSFALFTLVLNLVSAQSNNFINYQAVVRDSQNQILTDHNLALRFTFLQNGVSVYEETDQILTSAYGVANTKIGDNDAAAFKNIVWTAGVKLRIGLDANLSAQFVTVGQDQEMGSVPLSQFAFVADSARFAPGDNWGTQLVEVLAPIKGDGTTINPLDIRAKGINHGHLAHDAVTTENIQDSTITAADLSASLSAAQWKVDSFGNIFRDTLGVSIGTREVNGVLTVKTLVDAIPAIYGESSAAGFAAVFVGPTVTTGTANFIEDVYVDGYLEVEGSAKIYNFLTVDGNAYFQSEIETDGNAWFNNNIDVDGYANFDGSIEVGGDADIYNNIEVGNSAYVENRLVLQGYADFSLESYGGSFWLSRNSEVYTQWGKEVLYNGWIAPEERYLVPGDDDNTYLGLGNHRWKSVVSRGGVIETSDRNAKTNIKKLSYGLTEIMQMNPVSYNWKSEPNGKVVTGFIAQEMEKIVPEAVVTPAEMPKSVEEKGTENADAVLYGMNYTKLIPVTVKAIQEQQAQIAELQTQLAELRKELEILKK